MKGKILGILMIFCFVAPVVTIFVVLHYQKKAIKKEVKWKMIAGIDKDELVLLKFTEEEKKSQLNWEHSKEFEYNGEMYDVVEKKVVGDTTFYWVWWDHEETKLNQQLNNLFAKVMGNHPKNQDQQKRFHQFFKTLYCSDFHQKQSFVSDELRRSTFSYLNFYQSTFYSPSLPPPDVC